MRARSGFPVHCVLLALLSLYLNLINADLTLYGLAGFEGQFLTEAFQPTSIDVGPDGVITVIDKSATDAITAHGTFEATYIQSGNVVVLHAGGSAYTEFASCTIDPLHPHAACSISESIAGEGTKTEEFDLTTLNVVAVLQTGSQTQTGSYGSTSAVNLPKESAGVSDSRPGLSTPILAAIIAATAVVVLLIITIAYCIMLRRRRHRVKDDQAADLEKMEGEAMTRRQPRLHDMVTPQSAEFPFQSMTILSETDNPFVPPTNASNVFPSRSSSNGTNITRMSSKERMMHVVNDSTSPSLPSPSMTSISNTTGQGSVSVGEARQILEEMRRMRMEVEQIRANGAEVPPEYSA